MVASPAWQQASPVWIIIGNDGASSDDGVLALTSLVVRVQCRGLELVVATLFLLFSELNFGFVQSVSMSQFDRLEFFFLFVKFVFWCGCWSLLYRCAHFGFIFFLI
jgi:hypothetical protein